MSDFLFTRPDRALKLRLTALAAVAAVLLAAGSAWLGLSFMGVVGRDVPVTVRVTTLGDSLGVNSSVKFRGLRIGRVQRVDNGQGDGGTYSARVVIDRRYAAKVPAGVVARVLPGTIFGADYVDLTEPSTATTTRALAAGDVVEADRSAPTVRLMDTFDATQRVLGAIDPATMDQALSQLADALDGKGAELRGFITRGNGLLRQAGAAEPTFYADLALIARNANMLGDLEPALAQTLRDSLPTARTIAAKARSTSTLMRSTSAVSADVTAFLAAHAPLLGAMLDAVMPTYRAFVGGIGPFTQILSLATAVLRNGALAIKDGAIQMRAQFDLDIQNPYSAADCPRYGRLQGKNCR